MLSGYAGMMNNPTAYIDPDGRNPLLIAVAIGAAIGGITNGLAAKTQGKSFWSGAWKGAIVGGLSGLAGFYAPTAAIAGLSESIAYGVASRAFIGTVGDALNGGNGSGMLWGALSGGAFAGINWGMQNSQINAMLHNSETALASNGEPIYRGGTLNEVTVTAKRNRWLDIYGKKAAVSGALGNIKHVWTGGIDEDGVQYDRNGYPYGRVVAGAPPALLGGPAGAMANGFNVVRAFKNAISSFKGGSLTNVGRAVTKHPEYFGFKSTEDLTKVHRSTEALNKLGSSALKDILRNGTMTTGAGGRYPNGWVTFTLPNENAASWGLDGIFIGFRGIR